MTDVDLVNRKLVQLNEYITDLQGVQDCSLQEFSGNKQLRRFVERTLHIAIECALDIGNHIISDNVWREPQSNKDVFVVLCENNIVSQNQSQSLQKMAQFRNLLVHDYARIDETILFGILKKNVNDLVEYVVAITSQLAHAAI